MPVNRAILFLTSVITLLPWCIQIFQKTLLSKHCTACATKRFPHPNTSQISFLKPPFTHLSIPFPTLLLESPHVFSCATLLFTYLNLQPTQADVSQSCLTSQYFSIPSLTSLSSLLCIDKNTTLTLDLFLSSWQAPSCHWQTMMLSSGCSN